jgi:hypothetical protein
MTELKRRPQIETGQLEDLVKSEESNQSNRSQPKNEKNKRPKSDVAGPRVSSTV